MQVDTAVCERRRERRKREKETKDVVKLVVGVLHFSSGLIMESTYSAQLKEENYVYEECNRQKKNFFM